MYTAESICVLLLHVQGLHLVDNDKNQNKTQIVWQICLHQSHHNSHKYMGDHNRPYCTLTHSVMQLMCHLPQA